jgi:hypothetical protein
MLLTCPNKKIQKWFERVMEEHFTLVKQYHNISYLGMQIHQDKRSGNVILHQHGFINTLLTKHRCDRLTKFPSTPITEAILQESKISSKTDKKEYLSLVMSLMYLARFTRPDIHFAVSFLATRCSAPTVADRAGLQRILRYLAGTQHEGIQFRSNVPFKPVIAADASHHLYPEGHGQQGLVISNGSAPVGHRSVKIKLMTRSSSESELCSLEDASTYAVWYCNLLEDLGFKDVRPITIFQDNKSTIIMAVQGATFRRTKHLIGKQTFIRERIDNGEVKLSYMPTKDMIADILTKALPAPTFDHLKTKLCMVDVEASLFP